MGTSETAPGEQDVGAVPATPILPSLKSGRAVTFRAVMIGLLLLPINAYWVIQMEQIRYSAHPTTISLFFNAVFILLVVLGLNQAWAHFSRRTALRQGELLLIYGMVCIGTTMCAHDLTQILVPSLTWPYYFADKYNGWAHLFLPYLPKWALVDNREAVTAYFNGNSKFETKEHVLAWLPAVLIWTTFLAVLLFTMQCINAILRKQWTENERLTYPVVRLPIEITECAPGGRGGAGIFGNRLFWIGFALAAGTDIINSLNYYFPSIPTILTPGNGSSIIDLQPLYFTTKPWYAVGWTPITWYPFLIGFGMLLPTDFLFSAWFFYLFWKLELIASNWYGWDADPRMPYTNYQSLGAYLMFCVSSVLLSRPYLTAVVRRALGLKSDVDDSKEPLRYRTALLGAGIGTLALIAFANALGLSIWLGVLFFLIYFALAISITRMRAELGTPVNDLHFTGPDWTLTDLFGQRALGPQNLTALTLFFWFNRAYRAHPMPVQLESFKMAEHVKADYRKWFWAMLLAGVVGALCGFWAMLHLNYAYGAQGKAAITFGSEAYDRLSSWMRQPKPPNTSVALAIIVGFLFAAFLQAMRVRFPWWPFHPLAFAVTSSWEINLVWMPLFITWVIKSAMLRYSADGARTYLKSLPLFYGLILGQFVVGSILNIFGVITNTPTYQFWQ